MFEVNTTEESCLECKKPHDVGTPLIPVCQCGLYHRPCFDIKYLSEGKPSHCMKCHQLIDIEFRIDLKKVVSVITQTILCICTLCSCLFALLILAVSAWNIILILLVCNFISTVVAFFVCPRRMSPFLLCTTLYGIVAGTERLVEKQLGHAMDLHQKSV